MPARRFLTIVGPGGIGKATVANTFSRSTSRRNAAIARQRQPALGEITSAVVDPKMVSNPLISASVR